MTKPPDRNRQKKTVKVPPPSQGGASTGDRPGHFDSTRLLTGSGLNPTVIEDLSGDPLLATAPRVIQDGTSVPKLGKILLLKRLGKGAMGAVYYGIHANLRVGVALKVLHHFLAEQNPTAIKRFFREAQTAARVSSPHLVNVMDVDEDSGLFYIVMEYIDGQTASEYIENLQRQGQLGASEFEALQITVAATEGLAAAHEKDIIHRDVKPVNILVPRNRIGTGFNLEASKLADLGLARTVDQGSRQDLTGNFTAMGTPGFMAPEQVLNAKSVGKPADVFAMGATLYHLLCGVPPFRANTLLETMRVTAMEPPPPLGNSRPDVSFALNEVLYRCLEKDPSKRFPDAVRLLAALKSCVVPDALPGAPSTTFVGSLNATSIPETSVLPSPSPTAKMPIIREEQPKPAQPPEPALPRPVLAAGGEPPAQLEGPAQADPAAGETLELPGQLGPQDGDLPEPDRHAVPGESSIPSEPEVIQAPAPDTTACKIYEWWPFDDLEARKRQRETAAALGMPVAVAVLLPGEVRLELNLIPAGRFLMGSPPGEKDRNKDEQGHYLLHSRPFFLGVYPATQAQWQAVTGRNPSHFKDRPDSPKRPVERVSWTEIQKQFMPRIQHLAPRGWKFRLAAEAEWEYACRAGTESPFYFSYDPQEEMTLQKSWATIYDADLLAKSRFKANAGERQETTPVGTFPPNAWGLQDMAGNVWEWCQDVYAAEIYQDQQEKDRINERPGPFRVLRGGSWNYSRHYCRSACRYRGSPDAKMFNFGFRIAMVIR